MSSKKKQEGIQFDCIFVMYVTSILFYKRTDFDDSFFLMVIFTISI